MIPLEVTELIQFTIDSMLYFFYIVDISKTTNGSLKTSYF